MFLFADPDLDPYKARSTYGGLISSLILFDSFE